MTKILHRNNFVPNRFILDELHMYVVYAYIKKILEVPIQANRLYLAYTDINFFLIQNISRQDEKNNLFIHSTVLNTI